MPNSNRPGFKPRGERRVVGRHPIGCAASGPVLAIVAAVFLPLGLLTGLLGINVGGMPCVESPLAFWVVCGILVVLAAFEIWYLRRRKMF